MRPRVWAAAILAGALAAAVSACGAGGAGLTLEEVGAEGLSGLNGPTVADLCDTLPDPSGVVSSGCGRGSWTGVSNTPLPAGTYAVVLLCEDPGTYQLEATSPVDAFDAFEVACSDDDDPAVGPRFTVPESGVAAMHETFAGEGQSVVMLVRVADGA